MRVRYKILISIIFFVLCVVLFFVGEALLSRIEASSGYSGLRDTLRTVLTVLVYAFSFVCLCSGIGFIVYAFYDD